MNNDEDIDDKNYKEFHCDMVNISRKWRDKCEMKPEDVAEYLARFLAYMAYATHERPAEAILEIIIRLNKNFFEIKNHVKGVDKQ